MITCYNCQQELDQIDNPDEHILLNAIGGRLTSNTLFCRDCNSKFGSDCDAELARQLDPVTSSLRIKKHRGHINPIKAEHTVTGEKYVIHDGSKPAYAKPIFNQQREGNGILLVGKPKVSGYSLQSKHSCLRRAF